MADWMAGIQAPKDELNSLLKSKWLFSKCRTRFVVSRFPLDTATGSLLDWDSGRCIRGFSSQYTWRNTGHGCELCISSPDKLIRVQL